MAQTVYIAKRNADIDEGKGPMKIVAAFSSYEEAANYIDWKPGVQNRTARWSIIETGDWQIEALPVYNAANEVEEMDTEDTKRNALRKLSNEEKKALGLE